MLELKITITGPAGSGKTLVAHFLCAALRSMGCRVELREEDEVVRDLMSDVAAVKGIHTRRPSVSIVTRQGD